ncbi:MAG: hypothetical protein HUU21_03850 [Polyangiaceae bacterium]|nr:hypothetical protein [Polyangiaceae bacterium]
MRDRLTLIAAITVGGFAACNYTDGECWYYGEGTENAGAAVGPGGGVMIPTGPAGVGGYGDAPPEQPKDDTRKPKCNSDEDSDADSDEEPEFGKPADQYIDCKKRGLSAYACSEVCLNAGTGCGPVAGHPYKKGQGLGQLIWCKNGSPTYVCDYAFPNGDACAMTYTPLFTFWLCSYAGGK